MSDRLFVPLASKPYQWFKSGQKQWELRRYGRQYTEKHVRPQRQVELRLGYSDPNQALWGTIIKVETAESLEDFFDRVPFKQVIPNAQNLDEAIATIEKILGLSSDCSSRVLGFEVLLNHAHHSFSR